MWNKKVQSEFAMVSGVLTTIVPTDHAPSAPGRFPTSYGGIHMKKTLLASVAALALMAAAPAWAAHHDNQGDNNTHHGHGGSGGATTGGGHSGSTGGPHGKAGGSGGGSGGILMGTGSSTGGRHGGGGTGSTMMGSGSTGGRHGRGNSGTGGGSGGVSIFGGTMGGTMSGSGHRDRSGRGDHRNNNTSIIFGIGGHDYRNGSLDYGHSRHNSAFDQFRRAFNAPRHYRYGSYRRPHGWYYRRWNYGDFLPALFFGQDYWISDYRDFDLPYPPEGTVWVRYGNDALLVDEDTGEIIQVIYGIFY
jgi:Ni/Co efflux regulator RcnB